LIATMFEHPPPDPPPPAPVTWKLILVGEVGASDWIERVAFCVPVAAGVALTVTVQLCPGLSVLGKDVPQGLEPPFKFRLKVDPGYSVYYQINAPRIRYSHIL